MREAIQNHSNSRNAIAVGVWLRTRRRMLALTSLLLFAAHPLSYAAGEPADPAAGSQPVFVLGSAYPLAAKQEASGIYVLGTTRLRSWTATHYVLVRYGRGLQIHTKANGAWLPKLAGSSGGHTVGVERFDELLSIAGGVNRDVRQLPAVQRDRFFCVAGFGGCVGQTSQVPETTASRDRHLARSHEPAGPASFFASLLGAQARAAGICAQCQPYFASADPGREFRFEFDGPARGLWFQGWGIRGGWRVPQLDEI